VSVVIASPKAMGKSHLIAYLNKRTNLKFLTLAKKILDRGKSVFIKTDHLIHLDTEYVGFKFNKDKYPVFENIKLVVVIKKPYNLYLKNTAIRRRNPLSKVILNEHYAKIHDYFSAIADVVYWDKNIEGNEDEFASLTHPHIIFNKR